MENPFMKRPPAGKSDAKPVPFQSNQEILDAYLQHVKKFHANSTQRTAFYQIRKFLEYWGSQLILDVSRAELIQYVEVYEAACTNFRRGGLKSRGQEPQSNWCTLGLPLDCKTCPSYEGGRAATVEQHLMMVSGLFHWMVDKEHLLHNDWALVLKRWRGHARRRLKKEVSARRLNKRFLSHAEMVQLIERSPEWTWRITVLLGARYFLRASELARLKVTPRYLDVGLEWIVVPLAAGNNGKRIVEVRYPVDQETRDYLRVYLRWRRAKLARCGQPENAYEALIINKNGRPFRETTQIGISFTRGIQRMAKAAGLQDPPSIESHVLRRFASDRAQQNGLFGNELKLVRGDWLETDATGAYLDTRRLADLFAKASPPLGLKRLSELVIPDTALSPHCPPPRDRRAPPTTRHPDSSNSTSGQPALSRLQEPGARREPPVKLP